MNPEELQDDADTLREWADRRQRQAAALARPPCTLTEAIVQIYCRTTLADEALRWLRSQGERMPGERGPRYWMLADVAALLDGPLAGIDADLVDLVRETRYRGNAVAAEMTPERQRYQACRFLRRGARQKRNRVAQC